MQAPPSENAPQAEFPELRVSTITPGSVEFLKRTVAWQDVAPPKSAAFKTMQVMPGQACAQRLGIVVSKRRGFPALLPPLAAMSLYVSACATSSALLI